MLCLYSICIFNPIAWIETNRNLNHMYTCKSCVNTVEERWPFMACVHTPPVIACGLHCLLGKPSLPIREAMGSDSHSIEQTG